MATMIPAEVGSFATEGERLFYRFLEMTALPNDRFTAWYTPDIGGREPDFVLLDRSSGLTVFEVKDWALEQIRMANQDHFSIRFGGREVDRKSPARQAREYAYRIIDRLQEDGQLVSRDPSHHGKPKVPINFGVVFPNINKIEYMERNLARVISTDKIFFWDDLHPSSDICTDPTGGCFFEALVKMYDLQFSIALTGKECLHLKQLMFPEVRVQLPEREPAEGYLQRQERIRVLDNHQEAIARKFDGGHRILVGPSGSGKTLILVHRAIFLTRYSQGIRRVLFVCYNVTLVNYIKRLLADRVAHLGEHLIDVLHFYELCSRILDQQVDYENEGVDYYELIDEETLGALENSNLKYDAILVDEGQDFSDSMYRILTALLNPETNHLMIALDESQNIYRRKATWKEVGVQARGRTHRLASVYRNTREITDFSRRFLEGSSETDRRTRTEQLNLFPDFYDFHGPLPTIRQFPGHEGITEYVAEKIHALVASERCPLSEIAVIYAKKSTGGQVTSLIPHMMESALSRRGILCYWVSESIPSKKSYDITTDRVTISTIHSVKGLDYAHVFIVGLDLLDESRWTEEQIRNLTYVAITRARYQLFLLYQDETPLIRMLQRSLQAV